MQQLKERSLQLSCLKETSTEHTLTNGKNIEFTLDKTFRTKQITDSNSGIYQRISTISDITQYI